jgi:diphthamide synthase (EF-2-diphthine--ammonia ligase)
MKKMYRYFIGRNQKTLANLLTNKGFKFVIVPRAGLEPARPQWSRDFKSRVSTNSTTRAN